MWISLSKDEIPFIMIIEHEGNKLILFDFDEEVKRDEKKRTEINEFRIRLKSMHDTNQELNVYCSSVYLCGRRQCAVFWHLFTLQNRNEFTVYTNWQPLWQVFRRRLVVLCIFMSSISTERRPLNQITNRCEIISSGPLLLLHRIHIGAYMLSLFLSRMADKQTQYFTDWIC